MSHEVFLDKPGVSGGFGALMDEYARAAEDFCRVVERVSPKDFERLVESPDPDCVSIRAICVHAVRAARGYANYIRRARGISYEESVTVDPALIPDPAQVRPQLANALRYTEGALEGFYDADWETVVNLKFQVRWGPTYDAEMILEHAVCHLLRHRRQIERWPS